MSCTRLSCKCVFIKNSPHVGAPIEDLEKLITRQRTIGKHEGGQRFRVTCASRYFFLSAEPVCAKPLWLEEGSLKYVIFTH